MPRPELIVLRSLQPAHMVDDQAQAGMPLRDLADLGLKVERIHHHRNVHRSAAGQNQSAVRP